MKLINSYLYKEIEINKVDQNKTLFLKTIINQLIFHKKNCLPYSNFINNLKLKLKKLHKIQDIPFLHVNVFKEKDLFSVKKSKIYKILNSSGTSNQKVSKIYLDSENAKNQIVVLKKIINSIIGHDRLPMLIFEKNPNFINRQKFGAKIAAIIGFSIFGKDYTYAINSKNEIDYRAINSFLKKVNNKKFFIFGFTNSIYEYLVKKINNKKLYRSFDNSILIHGGGWKKLEKYKIKNENFKKKIIDKLNVSKIINYYGLVEQTGSIFIECDKCNCFHTNIFNDVIIRDKNLNPITEVNKIGMIQVLSILPSSYPGNSILLEDEGYLINKTNKNCKNTGKSFKIEGRIPKAEIRGCSDV